MRQAIDPCSHKKVAEMIKENQPLKEVFDKIITYNRSQDKPLKSLCSVQELSSCGLSEENLKVLVKNGVVSYEKDFSQYSFSPIFCAGLNIKR
ncbi:hypothetical protein ACQZV8_10515 [Magnetococcales bacterium HHB-1]